MKDITMPHNSEAQEIAIASAISFSETTDDFVTLSEDDFYGDRDKKYFLAIKEIYARDGRVDVMSVYDHLKDQGITVTDLIKLADKAITSTVFEKTVDMLRDMTRRRALIKIGLTITQQASDKNNDSQELLQEVSDHIEAVSVKSSQEPELLYDIAMRRLQAYLTRDNIKGIPTGLKGLDKHWAGLFPKELSIIAARPSMGKTALAQHIAENVARHTCEPVLFFSLEMGREYLGDRYLSTITGIDLDDLRRGYIGKDRISKAAQEVSDYNYGRIFIDDSSETTTFNIQAQARKIKRKHGLSAVFIDFLTLMADKKGYGENEHLKIHTITRRLRVIAKNLDIPVVVLAQLSRSVESRPNKRPKMSDLRESGGIEEAADNVLLLYREEYYEPDTPDKGIVEINVAKQKQGPRGGVAVVYFDPPRGKFFDITTKQE